MGTDRAGGDPTPRAGDGGAYRKTPTQLASDPAFTGTYVPKGAQYRTRRGTPGSAPLGRPATITPTVMASPPTVTYLGASAITSNVVKRFTPPVNGKCQGGVGLVWGSETFVYYSNRTANNTTLTAAAAAGATTLSLTTTISTGTYAVQPSSATLGPTSGYTSAYVDSAELVSVTAVAGSGPYTATLAAPLVNGHNVGDTVVTTAVPSPGYNTGSAIDAKQYSGSPQVNYEIITDAPTVEFFAYFINGGKYRLWVDGQVVTAAAQTATNDGASGHPAANAAGFVSVAFGSRAFRRVRFETGGGSNMPMIGVSTAATDTVMCPSEPDVRALFVGDSYLAGFDDIVSQTSRLLGWDCAIIDGIGGTGYEADNTANIGFAARAAYRLPMMLAARPDIVVVALGLNDTNTGTLAASLTSFYAQLKAGLPNATVFVVGPWATINSTNTAKQPVATAIKAACAAAGITYIDTMLGSGPGPNPWVSGTGYTGTLTGVGNSDIMLNSDFTHPTPTYGIPYNAARIASGIQTALNG